MTTPHYSPTDLYRRLHQGNPGDAEFYVRAAQGAQRILELGCGWGRLTLPLASADVDVTAVDIEPEFLEELNHSAKMRGLDHRVRTLGQDIRQLKLPAEEKFDRVFIPYNTMYALGGKEQISNCLKGARAVLAPKGELWFDVYAMDEFHEQYDPNDDTVEDDEAVAEWRDGEREVRVVETTQVFHPMQRLVVTYEAMALPSRTPMGLLKMNHDYILEAQLLGLLEEAQLVVSGRFALSEEGKIVAPSEDPGPVFYAAEPA